MAGVRKKFSTLRVFAAHHPRAREGCLVDTSILFSASYPLDKWNEDAERIFELLAELQIPVYSNTNVRAEFLELHRRVLIPECLIDLLEDMGAELDGSIRQKLTSLRTRYKKSVEEEKPSD